MKNHSYDIQLTWTGNDGAGTRDYRSYRRDHEIRAEGRPVLAGSSDPAFRGDASRYNPEQLLVAALSSCHMLWYLHLCAVNGIIVHDYRDDAHGEMAEEANGAGQFTRVVLRPHVRITGDAEKARSLHAAAHGYCFIARSVNFPVTHESAVECACAAQTDRRMNAWAWSRDPVLSRQAETPQPRGARCATRFWQGRSFPAALGSVSRHGAPSRTKLRATAVPVAV